MLDPVIIKRWKADPLAFIEQVLCDPDTGKPFVLYEEERRFIRHGFTVRADGTLPYPELVFSAPKKSGKTALAAMALIYVVVVLGGQHAEAYCVANDYDQAQSRVFQAIVRMLRASPALRHSVRILADSVTFVSTGSVIRAIASDYASAAGSNPTITVFDELWGFLRESSIRLFDEFVPSPARKVSVRLTVTYAGFSGESALLDRLYKRGLQGEQIAPDLRRQPGMLCYWSSECRAPWQTEAWREQMREQLRPSAYRRLIENQWVAGESEFVPTAWWDACVDEGRRPILGDRNLDVWAGLDVGVKRDSTALVLCASDGEAVHVVMHRVWIPQPDAMLDFEHTLESALLDAHRRFNLRECRYDPTQAQASAQRLRKAGVNMVEFPQTVPNLTLSSSNLYELLKGRNLVSYPSDEIRLALSRSVAAETARGWRIAKTTAGHKIDVVVALAFAALGAAQQHGEDLYFETTDLYGAPLANDGDLPTDDVGFADPEHPGQLLPDIAKRRAERLGEK